MTGTHVPVVIDREPWVNPQDAARDRQLLREAPIVDDVLRLTTAQVPAAAG